MAFPEPSPNCQVWGAQGHAAPISSHPTLPGRPPCPAPLPLGNTCCRLGRSPSVHPSYSPPTSNVLGNCLQSGWDQSARSKAGFTLPSEGAACRGKRSLALLPPQTKSTPAVGPKHLISRSVAACQHGHSQPRTITQLVTTG